MDRLGQLLAEAEAEEKSGRLGEAERRLRAALDVDAVNVRALSSLGRVLTARGKTTDAIAPLSKAILIEPANPGLRILIAWSLSKAGRPKEAEEHLREAIRLDPASSAAYGMLGFRLQELARFEEAIAAFRRGIELQPRQAGSYYGIVQSKRISEDDRPLIESMLDLRGLPDLPLQDRVFLEYALGKAHDDLGEYGTAIEHFDRANELLSGSLQRGYDRQGYAAYVDRTISTYTSESLSERVDGAVPDERPVFIVGMPRSGTTLVEQILSSHPQVSAAGELTFWRDRAKGRHPEAPGTAQAYIETIAAVGERSMRVTDKMPINFLFLGPIRRLLPRARVIHCRRHPVDTCLSIFMTRYVTPPEFAHDRSNIVFGYRQYTRLMDHWRKSLPDGTMLEIDYESLVTDREATTRRMLEFCGLGWNPACLKPEANRRSVTTPSMWQARQPVYSSSVGRWRNYQPWLGEFRALLPEDSSA